MADRHGDDFHHEPALLADQRPRRPVRARRYSSPPFAASTIAEASTDAAGSGLPTSTRCSSGWIVASFSARTTWSSSAIRRKRTKSGSSRCGGPLAAAAFGTPLTRSTHSRVTADTGQLVWNRKTRVSAEIGVRNRWTASPVSPGTSVMVGRFAPLTLTSGRILVNVRKTMLLLLGFGAMKNGLASAPPSSSYCAAIDETFRSRGISLYRNRTMLRRNCSSSTRRMASL